MNRWIIPRTVPSFAARTRAIGGRLRHDDQRAANQDRSVLPTSGGMVPVGRITRRRGLP